MKSSWWVDQAFLVGGGGTRDMCGWVSVLESRAET